MVFQRMGPNVIISQSTYFIKVHAKSSDLYLNSVLSLMTHNKDIFFLCLVKVFLQVVVNRIRERALIYRGPGHYLLFMRA